MQQSNNSNSGGGPNDLEFVTTVDSSIQQNVPLPPPPGTNNVLSNMINSAQQQQQQSTAAPASSTSISSPPQSSYQPSALPSALQFNQSSHPTACLFHILFKGAAFLLYTLGSKLMEDIMVTVLCILFLAADFWVVKNITGRLLVGLRWWNKVDPVTGNTSWIFESASPTAPGMETQSTNNFDSKFFWGILYITPVLWAISFLTAILWLQFQCFVTLGTALVLSASNVYGYYKCSADQRDKWNVWMNKGAEMGMGVMMRGGMFGWLGQRFMGRQQVPTHEPNTLPGTFA